jgi:Raf kinase inhibitor-like YbhB/YbcL family protein
VPPTSTSTLGPFELSSTAFASEETIPPAYACHGADVSPALEWTEPPAGTQSFALIMDDPDAVQVVGFVWDHWLLFNLPAETRKLPGEIPPDGELPDGSRHGMNSFPRLGYDGPCPPGGRTHRYIFTLYALDTLLDLDVGVKKADLLAAMEGHILAEAIYAGNYTSP